MCDHFHSVITALFELVKNFQTTITKKNKKRFSTFNHHYLCFRRKIQLQPFWSSQRSRRRHRSWWLPVTGHVTFHKGTSGKKTRGCLVGGFNPLEKYKSNWKSFPTRGENKKCLKPPPSCLQKIFCQPPCPLQLWENRLLQEIHLVFLVAHFHLRHKGLNNGVVRSKKTEISR